MRLNLGPIHRAKFSVSNLWAKRTVLALFAASFVATAAGAVPPRPNVLWLIIEDAGPDFGCYGNPDVHTPHLDRFAAESCVFRRAFATAPVCSPARSALMTGRYASSFDAQNHRSHRFDGYRRPDGVRLITERLTEAGYFTANVRTFPPSVGFTGTGKTDWNFFDDGRAFASDRWTDLRGRAPFFAQVNFTKTHRPYRRARIDPVTPSRVTLPPYLADDPVIREDWAAYLDELAQVDAQIGAVLRLVEEYGLRDSTAVFIFADHGREDFRGKYFAYEQGLAVPLLVRWPDQLRPGSASDRLVSLLDVHAGTLALAGLASAGLDGAPFFGPGAQERRYVFGARDRIDDTTDRVRTVRDVRYKYIRNFEPWRPYLQPMAYAEATNPSYRRMRELFAQEKLNLAQAKFMAARRPEEELYDLEVDPWELVDLAADPAQRTRLADMRATLDRWMRDTGDRGGAPEDPTQLEKEMDVLAKSLQRVKQSLANAKSAEVTTSPPGSQPPRKTEK
jgi:arylsulfatase A-like enzyme